MKILLRRILSGVRTKFDEHRATIVSVGLGAVPQVLRVFPSVDRRLDHLVDLLSNLIPLSRIQLNAALILSLGLAIRGAYALARTLYKRKAHEVRWLFGYRATHYPAATRGEITFRRDVEQSVEKSPFMYALLFAGYRLAFEEERFLLEKLTQVATTKEIRLLILDPNSSFWDPAAASLARTMPLDSFRRSCEAAVGRIKDTLRLRSYDIAYFDADPAWRLYLFSDRVYVSRYCRPPEFQPLDAKDVDVLAFDASDPATKPMYDWFFAEFRRHAPVEWQNQLPLPPLPLRASEAR